MERLNQHQDTLKHIADAALIPTGVVTGLANYMDLINGGMTFLVLLTSLIWGVYRIIDMRNTQRRTK
jgi:hypothetical protein